MDGEDEEGQEEEEEGADDGGQTQSTLADNPMDGRVLTNSLSV